MFKRTVLLAAVCLAFAVALAPSPASVSAQSRAKARSKAAPAKPEPAPEPAVDPATVTVYLAELGNAYHRDSCKLLPKSGGISVTLAEAKKNGYEWCKVCKPPK